MLENFLKKRRLQNYLKLFFSKIFSYFEVRRPQQIMFGLQGRTQKNAEKEWKNSPNNFANASDSIFSTMEKTLAAQPFILRNDLKGDSPAQKRRKRIFWKRFLICIASLSFMLPSLAMASPSSSLFSGFNASIGVGVEVPDVASKATLTNFAPGFQDLSFNVSRKASNREVNGSIRFGYNRVFKNLYLIGLVGDVTIGNQNLRFNSMVVEVNTDFLIRTNSNVNLSDQYALLLKLGRLVGARTLLYGLVGPRWGNFSLEFDASFHQNLGVIINTQIESQKKYYKQGVLFGIGSEFLLTDRISLALEYRHTYYGHPKLPSTEAAVTQDGVVIPNAKFMQSSTFTARNNDIMLRLGLYF